MNKNATILLVEDNEGDIILTLEALNVVGAGNEVIVARNGEEALAYLFRQDQFVNAATPNLILLDINLPKMNGLELLKKIKNDELLKIIPVIMLTTSNSRYDILDAYNSHANCYITKSSGLENFIEIVKLIKSFWLGIVHLPTLKTFE